MAERGKTTSTKKKAATATAKQSPSSKEQVSTSMSRVKRRGYRENVERAALICTMLFCGTVAFGIWYTNGSIITQTIHILGKAEPNATQSRNPAVICADPRNKNTPFCQDRAAETESNWASMSRVQGGRTNQFSLNKK